MMVGIEIKGDIINIISHVTPYMIQISFDANQVEYCSPIASTLLTIEQCLYKELS